jgi:hypothetical protein
MVNNMVRKFAVVTTFNQSGYSHYGSKMIDTFLATWPQEVDLYVYAEDCVVLQLDPRLHVIDLNSASPDLVAFKKQWSQVPKAVGQVLYVFLTRYMQYFIAPVHSQPIGYCGWMATLCATAQLALPNWASFVHRIETCAFWDVTKSTLNVVCMQ